MSATGDDDEELPLQWRDPLPIQEPLTAEDSDDSVEAVVVPTTKQQEQRWPQMATLFRDHSDTVMKMLRAVDECEVTTELNASDSGNVKGNKWVKLQDVVFGGRDDGTCSLVTEFPPIALPSKFK